MVGFDNILGRNTFGYANNKRNACIGSLHDTVGRKTSRNENDGGIRLCLLNSFVHGIENRNTLNVRASFTGRNASHNLSAVSNHLTGMKLTVSTGYTLYNDAGSFIYQYTHSLLILIRF